MNVATLPCVNENPASELAEAWPTAQRLVASSLGSSRHVTLATVGADGHPHATPIGSFMLLPEVGRAVYFERTAPTLRENLERDPRVSILAVNSGIGFWLRSLVAGRFAQAPALRLRGFAEGRRRATDEEIARWRHRVRHVRWTRGHDLLWANMADVREIKIVAVEPMRLGRMSAP